MLQQSLLPWTRAIFHNNVFLDQDNAPPHTARATHFEFPGEPGGRLNTKMLSYQYRDPMLKLRQSRDRLVFNIGIPIPGIDGLYIEMGPRARKSWIGHTKVRVCTS